MEHGAPPVQGQVRHEAPYASSHEAPWCLPNPPGQVFAFKEYRTWVSRLVGARSDQPDHINKGGNRVTHLNSPSLAQAGGCGSPVVLEVVIVGVIRISGIITIARAVRVRLPTDQPDQ